MDGLRKAIAINAQQSPAKLDRSRWEECEYCKDIPASILNGFCYNCGRPLTEEAWAELERRVIDKLKDAVSGEELALINTMFQEELTPEEVYTFGVRLCDNEVDQDFERFDLPALETLAKLFVGKSGIFDHQWSARSQAARIYRTELVWEDEVRTVAGEPYCYLKGYACMVRTESNRDLIADIEGTIKKEVNVSCAVHRTVCSICGQDINDRDACVHVKGRWYGNQLCYGTLSEPIDAFEWFFARRIGGNDGKTDSQTQNAPPTIDQRTLTLTTCTHKSVTWAQIGEWSDQHEAAKHFEIGDEISDTLKIGEEVVFVVVGKDVYEPGDVIFGLKDCLKDTHCMNTELTSLGGWTDSDMQAYLNVEIVEQLPEDLRAIIKPRGFQNSFNSLWLFSETEIFGGWDWTIKDTDRGVQMPYFKRKSNRVKGLGKDGPANTWWLRSHAASYPGTFGFVYNAGSPGRGDANYSSGVVFGFCV